MSYFATIFSTCDYMNIIDVTECFANVNSIIMIKCETL